MTRPTSRLKAPASRGGTQSTTRLTSSEISYPSPPPPGLFVEIFILTNLSSSSFQATSVTTTADGSHLGLRQKNKLLRKT